MVLTYCLKLEKRKRIGWSFTTNKRKKTFKNTSIKNPKLSINSKISRDSKEKILKRNKKRSPNATARYHCSMQKLLPILTK